MPAPLIGITTFQTHRPDGSVVASLGAAYIHAIRRAGGLPVLIPPQTTVDEVSSLIDRFDALLFTGGADIDPQRFNGIPHPRVYDIDPERDELELGLVNLAAERDLPFLGICRGIQVINVALGGTLYTDIADQLEGALRHDWYPDIPRDYSAHTVQLEATSRLTKIFGSSEVTVNSLHHQGVELVAPTLQSSGCAPDGLVEAVELPGHRFGIGVQWHPEALPDSAPMQALFRSFIEAAS